VALYLAGGEAKNGQQTPFPRTLPKPQGLLNHSSLV
jgi:hypothetical protein